MFETNALFSLIGKYLLPCAIFSGGWWAIQKARKQPFVLEQHLLIWLLAIAVIGQIFGGAGSLLLMAAVPPLVFSTACMMLYLSVQAVRENPVTQVGIRQLCVVVSVPAVLLPGMFIITFTNGMFGGEMEPLQGWLLIAMLMGLGWGIGRIISSVWLHFLNERIATGKTSYG